MKKIELTLHFEVPDDIDLAETVELIHSRINNYDYNKECIRMSFLSENDLDINQKLIDAEFNKNLLDGIKLILKDTKSIEVENLLNSIK